jgi:hypothetical protein
MTFLGKKFKRSKSRGTLANIKMSWHNLDPESVTGNLDILFQNIGIVAALLFVCALTESWSLQAYTENHDIQFKVFFCTSPEFRNYVADALNGEDVGQYKSEMFDFKFSSGVHEVDTKSVLFDEMGACLDRRLGEKCGGYHPKIGPYVGSWVPTDETNEGGEPIHVFGTHTPKRALPVITSCFWPDERGQRWLAAADYLMAEFKPVNTVNWIRLHRDSQPDSMPILFEKEAENTQSQACLFISMITCVTGIGAISLTPARVDATACRNLLPYMLVNFVVTIIFIFYGIVIFFVAHVEFLTVKSPFPFTSHKRTGEGPFLFMALFVLSLLFVNLLGLVHVWCRHICCKKGRQENQIVELPAALQVSHDKMSVDDLADRYHKTLEFYFEGRLDGNATMLDKDEFLKRYIMPQSPFTEKLAEKIYDKFEEDLISKAVLKGSSAFVH